LLAAIAEPTVETLDRQITPAGFACWSEVDMGPVRRPRLEGERYLSGARMVVRLGLRECLLCDGPADESVRRGRHARAAMYCSRHAGTAKTLRAHHRDVMHNALEQAARFHGIR